MGNSFARLVHGKKLYKKLVSLQMMGLKLLIKYLDYHKESEKIFASIFMTTKGDLGKDRLNVYHTPISSSFIKISKKQESN